MTKRGNFNCMPRKYKKVSKCLPKLENLIYEVNLIPADFQMQSLQFLTERGLTVADALQGCLKYTPQEFQEHIEFVSGFDKISDRTDEATRNFYVRKMAAAYIEYYEMRASMLMLVRRVEVERAFPNSSYDWSNFPLVLRSVVIRDADGMLQDQGLASLFGKFDDDRLRSCKACRRIFWAKKLNSETCGNKKCADDLGNKKRLHEAKVLREKQNNHFKSRIQK